jgi:hypothetical protein
MVAVLKPLMRKGKVAKLPNVDEIRKNVLKGLKERKLSLEPQR